MSTEELQDEYDRILKEIEYLEIDLAQIEDELMEREDNDH